MSLISAGLLTLAGVLLDRGWGEVRRWHPLVGFGKLAAGMERALNEPDGAAWRQILAGGIGLSLLVAPPVMLSCLVPTEGFGLAGQALILYFALGARSLEEHASAVHAALLSGNLEEARRRVGWIVSRETAEMDEAEVSRATIESVLENGNDAIFATLFWFLLLGAPGAVLYRLSNTLDAMWGYRNPRFLYFGRVAARWDDLLNWVPARLTALSYALVGNRAIAFACWRKQAAAWESPNAGPVMSAGAGALNVQLGGAAVYHGMLEQRPALGAGNPPVAEDICRAISLVRRAVVLWLLVALLTGWGVQLA
jgi:adenosylcobinamide-phosphate synthase